MHLRADPTTARIVPFGGYWHSGSGRDRSLHAFDKYTELKTTWLRINGA